MPRVDSNGAPKDDLVPVSFGRFGYSAALPWRFESTERRLLLDKQRPVHVMGDGEFMHVPFLLAQHLEKQGYDAYVQSTTRSPILVGAAITSKLAFTDHYDEGIENFLYNVPPENAQVIFCHEARAFCTGRAPFYDVSFCSGLAMKLRLFTDIDDTWMTTSRKVTPQGGFEVGAVNKDGRPSSFMSPAQVELFRILEGAAASRVPVTARSPEALARVNLSFEQGAIVDFGATILLEDGTVDLDWRAQMQAHNLAADTANLFDELARILRDQKLPVNPEQRCTRGVRAFLNFRGASGCSAVVCEAVEQALAHLGSRNAVYLHVTDRDVTVLPIFISKGYAVQQFIEQRGWKSDALLGCGDSLSDCTFLELMDFSLIPKATRAFESLRQAASLRGELA